MCFILNIETATKNCSVAIALDGKVLAIREISELGYSHAEKLHVFIDEVLKESKVNFTQLAAIAVSKGPGSYTGLRIGVSAAKGLCYALGIPLISLDTLEILAKRLDIEKGVIIPMIDARRMEVYSAAFNAKHERISEIKAEIITPESYSDQRESIYIVGDCQEKLRPILDSENIIFKEDIIYPSANEMAELSFGKFQKKLFEDVAYFEPLYLKEFLIAKPKS